MADFFIINHADLARMLPAFDLLQVSWATSLPTDLRLLTVSLSDFRPQERGGKQLDQHQALLPRAERPGGSSTISPG